MKTIIHLITYYLTLSIIGYSQALKEADKSLYNFTHITGFHSHIDKQTGFEYRIIEVDGSATVAINPIYLYLIITNNSAGSDLQTKMLSLPKVSSIQKIKFSKTRPTITIHASFDHPNNKPTKKSIHIQIPIKDNKIPPTIQATIDKLK